MSYENTGPVTERYTFKDATFGATTVTHNMIGPKGCVGFVRDIVVDVETTLVGTTTVPEIDIGTASGDTTYGRYRLGTTAILGYTTGIHRATQEAITGNPPKNLQDFAHHVEIDGYPLSATAGVGFSGRIPKDTAFVITALAGVGGTPAGGGTYTVVVDWQGRPIS